MTSAELICHPSTRTDAVGGVQVFWARGSRRLALTYRLRGEIGRLSIPPRSASRRADRLWEDTCCEIFIAPDIGSGYHELNFAPSGQWAVYAFAGYRAPQRFAGEALDPRIEVRSTASDLELAASFDLDGLSSLHTTAPLRVGLSAVAREANGTCSYWALRHPPGRPDFHHADGFVLRLQPAMA